jgi:nucleotide-binding universal stress UspA family protein
VFLEEARAVKADLVVMGAHGHSAIGEIVLGSVARKMIHKTTVPVMLMPYFGGQ